MSDLTGKTPADTYKSLLQMPTDADGVTAVLQDVQDGKGVASALQISTTAVHVNGDLTLSGTVDGRDIAADGSKLDGISSGAEVNAVDSVNTKTGTVVIDPDDLSDAATTNKFTTAADITKLSGIEAGAEVNDVDTVNTQTGAVVLDADDISDSATTNKYTTAGDITKLSGIESGATADQSDAEIETAYQTQVPLISQGDAEAGIATAIESWSAVRVKQAIAALETGGGLANIVEDLTPQLGGNLDLNGNVVTGLVIGTDVQAHSAVLDATTASFLTADETKLDGVEASADVTDTANVTAAGALMDSEVDADIKTLALPANTTISAFGASLVDDAAAANARTTLELVIGTDVQAHSAVLDATTASFLTADETKLDGVEAGATNNAGALADLNTVDTAEIDNAAVTLAKMADVATATVFYRKTAEP